MKGYLWVENFGVLEVFVVENQYGEMEVGWYDIGDIVIFDEQGYVCIQGCVKCFVKIVGEMIFFEMVEQVVFGVLLDKMYVMVIKQDVSKGEVLVLFIIDNELICEVLLCYVCQYGVLELVVL